MKLSDKTLAVVAAFCMACFFVVELFQETIDVGSAFSLAFSTWICVGAWHVLDDHEHKRPHGMWTLYLWFLRYKKF